MSTDEYKRKDAERARQYRRDNKEEVNRRIREKRAKNRVEYNTYMKAYKAANPLSEEKKRRYLDRQLAKQKEKLKTEDGKRVAKEAALRFRFGITLDQYEQMVSAQGGLCLLCKEPFDFRVRGGKSPVVDHDHGCCPTDRTCGKCIRGILHRTCNSGIGLFEDNAVKLRLAAEYLEKYKK